MATFYFFNTPDPSQKAPEILPSAAFGPQVHAEPLKRPTKFPVPSPPCAQPPPPPFPHTSPQLNLIADFFPS